MDVIISDRTAALATHIDAGDARLESRVLIGSPYLAIIQEVVRHELDRRILTMASSLAAMYHGDLDVVHAWHAVPRSSRVTSGSLARWNAEVAAERRCDVVVMGTLSRSGLSGPLIGNTCETVFQHLDASVLAINPEGFVSPLADDAGTA